MNEVYKAEPNTLLVFTGNPDPYQDSLEWYFIRKINKKTYWLLERTKCTTVFLGFRPSCEYIHYVPCLDGPVTQAYVAKTPDGPKLITSTGILLDFAEIYNKDTIYK